MSDQKESPVTYPETAVLTDVQVAQALQVGERTIERLDIPCHYIGTRTRRYIWGEVLAWLKTKKAA